MKKFLASDHFSVDGTLIEALASIKGFRQKDGGDNDSDGPAFVQELRHRQVTAHIAIDRRTLRHGGYAISQRCRKRIEEVFGLIKSSAGLDKVKLRGRARVNAAFTMALAAYNLVRLPKLLGAPA